MGREVPRLYPLNSAIFSPLFLLFSQTLLCNCCTLKCSRITFVNDLQDAEGRPRPAFRTLLFSWFGHLLLLLDQHVWIGLIFVLYGLYPTIWNDEFCPNSTFPLPAPAPCTSAACQGCLAPPWSSGIPPGSTRRPRTRTRRRKKVKYQCSAVLSAKKKGKTERLKKSYTDSYTYAYIKIGRIIWAIMHVCMQSYSFEASHKCGG